MANTTNFGWETPDDTDLVKDGAAAMRTLGNSIDTSMAQLKGGTTGQILSKTSNSDMAFTWIANDQGDITAVTAGTGLTGGGTTGAVTLSLDSTAVISPTIVDAKGDIIAATGPDAVARLAVGTNNQTLLADSTAATGLKWAASPQSLMTTTGDVLYASSANTPARLGIGSSGQVLTVSGGVPTWATPAGSALVGCSITATGTQSISNSTWTALTYNSESFDTDGFHDNTTNNTRITIPTGKGGKYQITSCCQWSSASGTGRRMLKIYINGVASSTYFTEISPVSSTYPFNLFSGVLTLSAGDYIETFVNQSSGGSDNMDKSVAFFNAIYLGA